MRVLVTGATQGTGAAVAGVLRARGDAVTALVARDSTTEGLYRLGCDLVEGEVTDATALRRALQGCDTVVHAAARMDADAPRGGDTQRAVAGTESVVRAAGEAGVVRVVHVSTTGVYGRASARVLTERLALRPTGHAGVDAMTAAEAMALGTGARMGLAVTVVRPARMYGPHDVTFLPRLAARLRGRRFVWVVDPETRVDLAHTGHVADVVLRALTDARAPGEVFNVADGTPLPWRTVVEVVCRHLKLPVPRVRVPTEVAARVAGVLETAWRVAGHGAPPVRASTVEALLCDGAVSTEKARTVLGYEPVMTTEEGLAQACDALT